MELECTAVMDYVMEGDAEKNLPAHKLWPFQNDKVICLIAGLNHTKNIGSIYTAFDQGRWTGTVTVNNPDNIQKEGETELHNVQWIQHAGFAYLPLSPSTTVLKLGEATGSWSSINKSGPDSLITEKVFIPILMHNSSLLTNVNTGYAIVPSNTSSEANKISLNRTWRILRNDQICQTIKFKDGTLMVAFFVAAELNYDNNKILRVNKPCLIFISKNGLYASDPSHRGGDIIVGYIHKIWKILLAPDGTTTKRIFSN